jgi:hypothetical protein
LAPPAALSLAGKSLYALPRRATRRTTDYGQPRGAEEAGTRPKYASYPAESANQQLRFMSGITAAKQWLPASAPDGCGQAPPPAAFPMDTRQMVNLVDGATVAALSRFSIACGGRLLRP